MITSAPAAALRSPQLAPAAPVIPRPGSQFQVGIDPRTALVFTGPGFGELLRCLDGRHGVADLEAVGWAAGLAPAEVSAALQRLHDAGLLLGPGSRPERRDRRIRLIGAGPVGLGVARQLIDRGIAALYVFDAGRPDASQYPAAGLLPDRATALCSVVADSGTPTVPLSHWSKPERLGIDLTVVIADGPEVDRVITDHLVRIDQPHLVVRSLGDAAWVGPLVVPGRTSCLRCTDLCRRDADPHWPLVLAQLSRLKLDLPEVLACWAASIATAQVLAFLGGEQPETAGATLELSACRFVTELRAWPTHAGCGCGWASPPQWAS